MRQIKLTKGKFAVVDDEYFDWLNKWKWGLANTGYAFRNQFNKVKYKKLNIKNRKGLHKAYDCILMHRLIQNTPKNMLTDHINRNKLDNRRCNLRNADKRINSINRGLPKNNKSGYKGVYWSKNRWESKIKNNQVSIFLGRFININDAILARKKAEQKYYATI